MRAKESLWGFFASDPQLSFNEEGEAEFYPFKMFRRSAEQAYEKFARGDNFANRPPTCGNAESGAGESNPGLVSCWSAAPAQYARPDGSRPGRWPGSGPVAAGRSVWAHCDHDPA